MIFIRESIAHVVAIGKVASLKVATLPICIIPRNRQRLLDQIIDRLKQPADPLAA